MKPNAIALVTGAVNGIGLAISKQLMRDGYFVILVDLDRSAGAEIGNQYPNACVFRAGDISKAGDVSALFAYVEKEFGRLDLLVNNAGIVKDNYIWTMPENDFDAVVDVNLKGTWLMCKGAAGIMKTQGSGRIVNIASRAWLGNKGQSNYSASKAGVIALTRVLALELGKYKVSVNAVAPGLIDTPLTRNLKKEVLENLIAAQPGKNIGQPEDIARAVAFLGSAETHFITGQVLYVDGGKSIGSNLST
ncbi:MAG TPA: SDR family NAD(P)-dependent oxidoreductase [Bacteroidia bacterium]|nr:SDR family NAD(P)-dependent oxidoreductase [Bacteroidia bacterium]